MSNYTRFTSVKDKHEKGDRALELREKGLSREEIAERLGVYPRNVGGMLQRAKERREKKAQERTA